MMRIGPIGGGAALLLLVLAGCSGESEANGNAAIDEIVTSAAPPAPGLDASGAEVVTVGTGSAALTEGATPMAERVAVLGLLNKRNGETREVELRPGQAARWGDMIVRLRACEKTAPWEPDEYTGAFVQLDVQQFDESWNRVFSGWLYKERPALNVVRHGIYDVWPKSCAMTFPDSGPATVSADAVASGGGTAAVTSRSSAPNAPAEERSESAPEPTPPAESPSAEDSSDR